MTKTSYLGNTFDLIQQNKTHLSKVQEMFQAHDKFKHVNRIRSGYAGSQADAQTLKLLLPFNRTMIDLIANSPSDSCLSLVTFAF